MTTPARSLAPTPVVASSERGLPPDQVEAAAFAWLARAFVERIPGNVAAVTGAAGPRLLGRFTRHVEQDIGAIGIGAGHC